MIGVRYFVTELHYVRSRRSATRREVTVVTVLAVTHDARDWRVLVEYASGEIADLPLRAGGRQLRRVLPSRSDQAKARRLAGRIL